MEPAPTGETTAGFAYRLGATLIDGLIVSPVSYPTTLLIGYGPAATAITFILITAPLAWIYTTVSHAKWGRTLGKRMMGIQVVRADTLGAIGYREAFLRDAPVILFSTLTALLLVRAVVGGNTEPFRVLDFQTYEYEPAAGEEVGFGDVFGDALKQSFAGYDRFYLAMVVVSNIWFWVEALTMLTNSRRRAVHDYLGGTVVTMRPRSDEPAAASF